MIKWIKEEKNKTKIVAFIFNPAFLGLILISCFEWYQGMAILYTGLSFFVWFLDED